MHVLHLILLGKLRLEHFDLHLLRPLDVDAPRPLVTHLPVGYDRLLVVLHCKFRVFEPLCSHRVRRLLKFDSFDDPLLLLLPLLRRAHPGGLLLLLVPEWVVRELGWGGGLVWVGRQNGGWGGTDGGDLVLVMAAVASWCRSSGHGP